MVRGFRYAASMKVPPKRKGNAHKMQVANARLDGLNESPSEKEGKSATSTGNDSSAVASMKVPPKRKGNL